MEGIITFVKHGIRTIKFNRPERKNAISSVLYEAIAKILNEDGKTDDTTATIFTGTGEYFTSGNDLKAVMDNMQGDGDPEEGIAKNTQQFKSFVSALINYPKILIAVVNGPAVGVGVTMLGLCDVVYVSDRATFHAPFVNLGLCAEACSSYTLPRIMGRSKASEMILLGHKMSAQEALQFGLVSRVVPHDKLDDLFVDLQKYGKLPINTVRINKKLLAANIHKILCECNDRECESLIEVITSDEFLNSVMSFMSRKSKL